MTRPAAIMAMLVSASLRADKTAALVRLPLWWSICSKHIGARQVDREGRQARRGSAREAAATPER